MLYSHFGLICKVDLPFKGRQMYMHSFDLENPVMPAGYEDYLRVVDTLCTRSGFKQGTAHMTVDEKIVKAGNSQRRPGPHVDGCYNPAKTAWDAHGGWGQGRGVATEDFKRMSVIVASSAPGCRVYPGVFDGEPDKYLSPGDLSHISDQIGEGVVLSPYTGYLLSPDCVHESLVLAEDTERTFVRIALPLH